MAHLVGDVSSAARILPDLDGEKLFIRRGRGAYLWDDRGRRYIDTALGFGAVLLGHSEPEVIEAVGAALQDAAAPSWAHVREHAAADCLARHGGGLDKVIFTNSGSEAVHLACRAARAHTGRPRIAKMAAGFDGWFDEVTLGNVGSVEATFAPGQRPASERMTLLRYNDFDDVERLFAEHRDIAAVLLEPMLANAGCIMAAPGYLAHVQRVAHAHGALVISDEVLMGFRRHPGLSSLYEGWTRTWPASARPSATACRSRPCWARRTSWPASRKAGCCVVAPSAATPWPARRCRRPWSSWPVPTTPP